MAKEIAALRRKLERMDGVSVRTSGKNHNKVFLNGRLVTTFPCTPGGGNRSLLNTRADLKRAGILV